MLDEQSTILDYRRPQTGPYIFHGFAFGWLSGIVASAVAVRLLILGETSLLLLMLYAGTLVLGLAAFPLVRTVAKAKSLGNKGAFVIAMIGSLVTSLGLLMTGIFLSVSC